MRAFVAVAEELHFGRAALRLGLSQPQVSRLLGGLERAVGVTLVERTARRVALTDAGEELLADARETLESVQRLGRRARALARGHLGTVSVGFLWSTLPGYLAPLVAAVGERHPQIELAVCQLRFTHVVEALRRGEVDLVIARPYFGNCEMVSDTLNAEPSVVAIPAGHPLAGQATIAHHQIGGEPMITLARELIPTAFDAARATLEDADIVPSDHRSASSPTEALALVAAGLGIYYRVPASAVIPWAGVVYREIDDLPMRTLLLRRPEPPGPALAAITALIVDLFSDAPDASNHARRALEGALPAP